MIGSCLVHLAFMQLRTYVAATRRLALTDEDQRELENVLLARPTAGAVIAGTGGLRKLRHAPRGRGGGKSGGVRVCYAYLVAFDHVVFVTAYGKNEQPNLSAAEKHALRAVLSLVEQNFHRRSR